jgi:hypothetical protein
MMPSGPVLNFISGPPSSTREEIETNMRKEHAKKVRAIEAVADFLRKAFPAAHEAGVELEAAFKDWMCGDIDESINKLVPYLPTYNPPRAMTPADRIVALVSERDELQAQIDAADRMKESMPDGFGDVLEAMMLPAVRRRMDQVTSELTKQMDLQTEAEKTSS